MGIVKDLSGKKFGRLTVIQQGPDKYQPSGKRVITWDCVCECGCQTNVRSGHLTSGHTWSCGCAHKEQQEAWKTLRLSHGRLKNREATKSYRTWIGIKRRCYNPRDIDFPYYGAAGIKMSDLWVNNPTAFCEYVESLDKYSEKNTTIDRIDFQKGYEPGNLRWITLAEQQRNKRNNVWITANGETLLLQEWANRTGIERRTISARLKMGWSAEDAVSIPPRKKGSDQNAGI